MNLSVVVLMCHILGSIPSAICHEVVVIKTEMTMMECQFSQPQIAIWKLQSIYRDEAWEIQAFKCVPGDYVPKDAV